MNNTESVLSAMKSLGEPVTRADLGETDECMPLNPDQISRALHDLVKRELIIKVGDRPITDRKRGQGKSLNVYALAQESDIDAELRAELAIVNLSDSDEPDHTWKHIEHTLAERIAQRDKDKAEAVLDDSDGVRLVADDTRESGLRIEKPAHPWSIPYEPIIRDQQTDLSITDPDSMSDSGDPIIRAIHRLPMKSIRLQGLDADISRARALAETIGDAGPDVSAWLEELAVKLETLEAASTTPP